MVFCAVKNCNVRSGQGIPLFKFPEKDLERRKAWIEKLNRYDYEPSSFARICVKHFDYDQFKIDPRLAASVGFQPKQLRLKENAVPSIFNNDGILEHEVTVKDNNKRSKTKKRKTKRMKIEEFQDDTEEYSFSSTDTEPYDPSDTNGELQHTKISVPGDETEQKTLVTGEWDQAQQTTTSVAGGWDQNEHAATISTSDKMRESSSRIKKNAKSEVDDLCSRKMKIDHLNKYMGEKRKKVICALARRNCSFSPTFGEKSILAANGLGDRVVEFPSEGSSDDVKAAIISAFPKLENGGGFEILWTRENNRVLLPISSSDDLFSVDELLLINTGSIYVRPRKYDVLLDKDRKIDAESLESQTQHQTELTATDKKVNDIVNSIKQLTKQKSQTSLENTSSSQGQQTISNSKECQMTFFSKVKGHSETFQQSLYELQQEGVLCDVAIQTAEKSIIYAHRIVLMASKSTVLGSLLLKVHTKAKTNHCIKLDLSVYNYITLNALIRYLYTGEIFVDISFASDLCKLCDWLQLEEPLELLKQYLTTNPDHEKFLQNEYQNKKDNRKATTLASTSKRLSEKLRDIIEKNEQLFQEIGINGEITSKYSTRQTEICGRVLPTEGKDENHQYVISNDATFGSAISKNKGQKPTQCKTGMNLNNFSNVKPLPMQMFIKSVGSDINPDGVANVVSYEESKCVPNDSALCNVAIGNDEKFQYDYLNDESPGKSLIKIDENLMFSSQKNSEDKTGLNSNVNIGLENVGSEKLTDEQYEGYIENVVIKTEPPCDYEDWTNKSDMNLQLGTDVYESIGNVSVKQEPLT